MPKTTSHSDSNVTTPVRRSARIQNVKTTVCNTKNIGKPTSSKKTTSKSKRSAGCGSKSSVKATENDFIEEEKVQEPFQSKTPQKRKHSSTEEGVGFSAVPSKVPRRSSARNASKSPKITKKETEAKKRKSTPSTKKTESRKKSSRRAGELAKTGKQSTKRTNVNQKKRKSGKRTPAKRYNKAKAEDNIDKTMEETKSERSDFDSVECEIGTADENEIRKEENNAVNGSIEETEVHCDIINEVKNTDVITSSDTEAPLQNDVDESVHCVSVSLEHTQHESSAVAEDVNVVHEMLQEPEDPAIQEVKESESISEKESMEQDVEIPSEVEETEISSDSKAENGEKSLTESEAASYPSEPTVLDLEKSVTSSRAHTEKEPIDHTPAVSKECTSPEPTLNVNGLFCSPPSDGGKVFGLNPPPSETVEQTVPIHPALEGYFIYAPGTDPENFNREKTIFVFCCDCMNYNKSDVLKLFKYESDMYFLQNLDSITHDAIVNHIEEVKKLKRYSLLMDNHFYCLIFDSSRLCVTSNKCLTSAQLVDKLCESLADRDVASIKEQIAAASVSLLQVFSLNHIPTNVSFNAGNLHSVLQSEDVRSLEVMTALRELLGETNEQVILTGDFKVKSNSMLNNVLRGHAAVSESSFSATSNPLFIDCERGRVKLSDLLGETILLRSKFVEAASEIDDKMADLKEVDIWINDSKLKPCALWKSHECSKNWTYIGLAAQTESID